MSKFEYISAQDLRSIIEPKPSLGKARETIRIVNEEIRNSGCLVLCDYRAPKDLVLKKLGLKGE